MAPGGGVCSGFMEQIGGAVGNSVARLRAVGPLVGIGPASLGPRDLVSRPRQGCLYRERQRSVRIVLILSRANLVS